MSDLRGAISEKVGGNVVNNIEDENIVHEEKIILNDVSVMYHGYLVGLELSKARVKEINQKFKFLKSHFRKDRM